MKAVLDTIRKILAEGVDRGDRTGTGTVQIPVMNLSFNLLEGTPMLTSRKQKVENVIHEILWFLRGDTTIDYLQANGCPFWDGFATKEDVTKSVELSFYERIQLTASLGHFKLSELLALKDKESEEEVIKLMDTFDIPKTREVVYIPKGSVGPMYGYLMRCYPSFQGEGIDQIAYVIHNLKTNPLSRRHLVDVWCPSFLPDERFSPQDNVKAGLAALAPCHFAFEFITEPMSIGQRLELLKQSEAWKENFPNCDSEDEASSKQLLTEHFDRNNIPAYYVDIKFHMRSNDVVLGLPANILGYSVLLMMIAQQVNMIPRGVHYTGSNVHVYANHLEKIAEWLERPMHKRPQLIIKRKPVNIDSYTIDDFELLNYVSEKHIKFPVSI